MHVEILVSYIIYYFQFFSLALLISALKAGDISYTPAVVKRTIENTAATFGSHDPLSIGHGIIQV